MKRIWALMLPWPRKALCSIPIANIKLVRSYWHCECSNVVACTYNRGEGGCSHVFFKVKARENINTILNI